MLIKPKRKLVCKVMWVAAGCTLLADARQPLTLPSGLGASFRKRRVLRRRQVSVLTVWDFDWSMVEDNSDTWVIERLGARPAFDALKEVRPPRPPPTCTQICVSLQPAL